VERDGVMEGVMSFCDTRFDTLTPLLAMWCIINGTEMMTLREI
jgi:hypothetical protein